MEARHGHRIVQQERDGALRSEQVWPGSNSRPVSPGRIRSSGPPAAGPTAATSEAWGFPGWPGRGSRAHHVHEHIQPGNDRPGPRPDPSRGRLHWARSSRGPRCPGRRPRPPRGSRDRSARRRAPYLLRSQPAAVLWTMAHLLAAQAHDDVLEHGDDPVDHSGAPWRMFDGFPRITWGHLRRTCPSTTMSSTGLW
jgi:hypothetical protein